TRAVPAAPRPRAAAGARAGAALALAAALASGAVGFCPAPPGGGTRGRRAAVTRNAFPWEGESRAVTSVKKFFQAWNERDMDAACAQFSDDCTYVDTQYDGAFEGKAAVEEHLYRVADALPSSFRFCIDEISDGGDKVGIQWHVENNGEPLPFTRGCSMYKVDQATGKIVSGFDVPEPAPLKPGSAGLAVLNLASKLIEDPVRAIPLFVAVAYVAIVFFSNGILPGPDATRFDPATWKEVLDLSINFWLISPLLGLPFAAMLHPGLEGIFNLLLAWAALFAGFLADGRPGRPSGSMLPTVIGMQFLTNAFYLPYLVLRTPEKEGAVVYREDLEPTEALVSESRLLGPLLAVVGTGAVYWGFFARPEYGDVPTRWASLVALLSGDRLGSSFVVDLALFALFQGWLVDDDLRRRGAAPGDYAGLAAFAKYVPFLGLCGYLLLRPELPSRAASADQSGGAGTAAV
ncbi:unnamed protein product, partial [Prorocentrum cordatum]